MACAGGMSSVDAEDRLPLTSGTPAAGRLITGESHTYVLTLEAGDFARVEVEQNGIDIGVVLRAPQGSTLAEIGYRSGDPRSISLIARETGHHEVVITALETEPREGRFVLELREKRAAKPSDRSRVRAAADFARAEQLWYASSSAAETRGALDLFRAALEQWKVSNDRAGQALAALRLGRAQYAIGASEAALTPLRQSLAVSQESEDKRSACAALTALASAEADVGSMQDATGHANDALAASRRSGDTRCEAAALNVSGDILSFTGKGTEASAMYEPALAISRGLRDRRGEALALLNLGYVHADLSRIADAMTAYESALAAWRSVRERRGEARTLIGIAQLHGIVGEKQQALTYYRQAQALVETLADRWGQAVVASGMGAAYLQLGEPQTASAHYRAAVELFRTTKVAYGEAANLLYLAASLAAVGLQDEALAEAQRALTIARSISDVRLEARALQKIGEIQADAGRIDDALAQLEQAAILARKVGFSRAETEAQIGIADLLHRQGRDAEARLRLDQAERLAQLGKDRFAESKALFGLARIQADGGQLEGALSKVRASLALVEDLRVDVASLDLRASYLASIRERQELEIELLTRLDARDAAAGYDRLAFEAAERARARSLLDSLAEARAQIREGVDPALVAREASLRQELNAKARRLMSLSQGDKAAALEKEIDELRLAHRELRDRIRAESPRYAALTEPRPLSLSDVQNTVVDEQSVLLQYFIGARQSRVWAVTKTQVVGRVLPGREEIESLVRPYREALAGPDAGGPVRAPGSAEGPDARMAIAVSRVLLGPVADQLGAARVVVVADGVLEALPFAALPDPRRSQDVAVVPLVQGHEVVHLPSASTLALIRGGQPAGKPWGKEVLVFADPVFEADDPRVQPSERHARAARPQASTTTSERSLRSVEGTGPQVLSRLIGSGQEARRIAALTSGAELRLGFQANVTSALDPAVGDHRIVHFATHAIVDNERPELSGIALSLFDERGTAREGFVRLYDVYNMKLPVDLVVLSGCSSAMGKRVAGEGLISLVRGFMYAGARLVLASLWKVDDEATSELMARFYQAMWKEGLQPAAALRAAQLELMSQRRWRHPFYWAGFVLSGDWDLRYSRQPQAQDHGTATPFRAARSAPPAAGTRPRAGGSALRAASPQPDHRLWIPGLLWSGRAGGRDARSGGPKVARDGDGVRGERPDAVRVRGGRERRPRVVQAPPDSPSPRDLGSARQARGGTRGRRAAGALPRPMPRAARGLRAQPGAGILRGREERQDPAPLDARERAGSEPECVEAQDSPHHDPTARMRLRMRRQSPAAAVERGPGRSVRAA
jgi:CHAT domain-containing protein/tetratricopeptide (TPR) repeat protein